jgi:hypothetical protein
MSMNPFDEIAVEEAIRLKETGVATETVVVSIGPKEQGTLGTGSPDQRPPCSNRSAAAVQAGSTRSMLTFCPPPRLTGTTFRSSATGRPDP